MIDYLVDKRQFHLHNGKISYVMELTTDGFLLQVHNGAPIKQFTRRDVYPKYIRSSFNPSPASRPKGDFTLAVIPQEFGTYDVGDYRVSGIEMTYPDGTQATTLKYYAHEIIPGKPKLAGLPATYANEEEAETLIITMMDAPRMLKVQLIYTIFADLPVITRSTVIENFGSESFMINKAYSAGYDFDDADFDYLQLPGSWAAEKQLERLPLRKGVHKLDSRRGASGSFMHPFTALLRKETNEFSGEVWGFHFVYSGNFAIELEEDSFNQTRVNIGISSDHFNWELAPYETFQTPEVVEVYSPDGLNGMSQVYHQLYQHHLVRGRHQLAERPVLINNWETTYFDFDEESLLALADDAKKVGVELFVLDDGWFGNRNDDTTSLGDWFVNEKKLPKGLPDLADKIRAKGLEFGIWVEPEMISRRSELYKEHPDWHIHVDRYPESLGRNQLVLDMSRQDVRDYLYNVLDELFTSTGVTYVKWDFNRNMTEWGSPLLTAKAQGEVAHRYYLGLYELLERLTSAHPEILFENCSGGGGRFDPGMTYYMPQSWASDNTDAVERMKIQYANSLFFPISTICAQVSEVPNHQTARVTPFATRMNVASSANMGIMQRLGEKTSEEMAAIAEGISWYKKNRKLIQYGTFTRLLSPFENNYCIWGFMDGDQSNGLLFFGRILQHADEPFLRIKLPMLDPHKFYQIGNYHGSGEEFMKYGLYVNTEIHGDFTSMFFEIKEIPAVTEEPTLDYFG